MKKKIGLRIKAIRQAAKMTQEVLAERCDVFVEAISNIERGVNYPHFETLVDIAKALNCRLSMILDDNVDDNISPKRAAEESLLIANIRHLSDEQIHTLSKFVEVLK